MAGRAKEVGRLYRLAFIPNTLTFVRMICIVPWAISIISERYEWALGILLIAAVTDFMDGFLARRFKWSSRIGSILDPLADKVFCNGVFWTLVVIDWAPWWLATLLTLRDAVVIAGAWICWRVCGAYNMRPSIWGKLSMMSTVAYMWWTLFAFLGSIEWSWLDSTLMLLVSGLLVVSAVDYILTGRRLLQSDLKSVLS